MKYGLFFSLLLQTVLVSAGDLSARLSGFSTVNESQGSFVETLSADYLNEPLISKGELTYKRPGQLNKLIAHPEHIEQRIDGQNLSVIHDGETRNISLLDQPEIAVGIYALQAVLDGDENKLHELFEIEYKELNSGWDLSLSPKDQRTLNNVELIFLQGKENYIQQIAIQFSNGDSLLTEITHE